MSYGPFYWVYAGTFPMTYQYTLTNGMSSPVSTATFKVSGLTGGPLANTNYGLLTVDNLTGCPAQRFRRLSLRHRNSHCAQQ